MQNTDFRAKQFLSFDALEGLKKDLKKQEIKKIELVENTDEINKNLNTIIYNLKKQDKVKIIYFKNGKYEEEIHEVKQVDYVLKSINLINKKIEFKYLKDIKKI